MGLLIGIFGHGCASTHALRITSQAPEHPLEVVAVLPVQLIYEALPFESQLRTFDLLSELWKACAWPILPPSDFAIIDPYSDDPLRRTDALRHLGQTTTKPHAIGVLSTSVSFREARRQATINSGGHQFIANAHELKVVVSMSLLGPRGRPLVELETTQLIDPFAAKPDHDPRPEVSAAIKAGIQELLNIASDWINPGLEVPLNGIPSLAALKRYSGQAATLEKESSTDPIQAQLRDWHLALFLDPSVDFDDLERLTKTPPGICLKTEDVEEPFRKGDCILFADDKPLHSLHLLRLLLHEREDRNPLTLLIRDHEGKTRSLQFPSE